MGDLKITDFRFDLSLVEHYRSQSQRIRIMSEVWIGENLYCPCCGNLHIKQQIANKPVGDFQCPNCGEQFELKSKCGDLGQRITDGAYSTMIERIGSFSNPHLLLMSYSRELMVKSLVFVPKFFFVPDIIEKRNPLADTAKRAGWTGCNILSEIFLGKGRLISSKTNTEERQMKL